jgi:hypothetical protein
MTTVLGFCTMFLNSQFLSEEYKVSIESRIKDKDNPINNEDEDLDFWQDFNNEYSVTNRVEKS